MCHISIKSNFGSSIVNSEVEVDVLVKMWANKVFKAKPVKSFEELRSRLKFEFTFCILIEVVIPIKEIFGKSIEVKGVPLLATLPEILKIHR